MNLAEAARSTCQLLLRFCLSFFKRCVLGAYLMFIKELGNSIWRLFNEDCHQFGLVSWRHARIRIGFYLPDIWLRIKTARRRERIAKGIPDALDLLVVCVEASMGLNAAINRVGEEIKFTHREVSDEFKLLNLELRTGKARDDALRNLANRIDLEDVNSLVTLLIQTDKFGLLVTSRNTTSRFFSRSWNVSVTNGPKTFTTWLTEW